MIALFLLPLLLAPTALATPWRRGGFQGACSDPTSDFTIPASLDSLTNAPGLVLVGVGVQNYTCNANSTFTSIGAVALLFDISCQPSGQISTIPNDAFGAWNALPDTDPTTGGLAQKMQNQFNLTAAGEHYFVNQNNVLEPVWDLRSPSGPFPNNPGAIVFAQKTKSVPSPDNPSNDVPWLELNAISGQLASIIYRINTVSGQPPGSCNPGDSTTIKYSANYLLS